MAAAAAKPRRKAGKARQRAARLAPADAGKARLAGAGKPIDLYYCPTPNGWKITIMLEECGLPYNIVPVNIARGDQFEPEFLAISPNNRMPAIVDHRGPQDDPRRLPIE